MRGSLIISFSGIDGRGGDSYQVEVNGQLRDLHFTTVNGLYSTFIYPNDVCSITIIGNTGYSETATVYRKDFTTDDEAGDKGIKESTISQNVNPNTGSTYTITFTATTRPDAYDFQYTVDINIMYTQLYFSGLTGPYTTYTGQYNLISLSPQAIEYGTGTTTNPVTTVCGPIYGFELDETFNPVYDTYSFAMWSGVTNSKMISAIFFDNASLNLPQLFNIFIQPLTSPYSVSSFTCGYNVVYGGLIPGIDITRGNTYGGLIFPKDGLNIMSQGNYIITYTN